jgi:molecular chaperone DnaK
MPTGSYTSRPKTRPPAKSSNIRIQASGGLSDADIEKMVKDAEANAESDKVRRALVETRNQAEALIHQTEKSIADLGADISPTDKEAAEKAIADLRSVLDESDKAAIEQKANALQQAAMKLGEAAYRKSQEQAAGAPDNAGATSAQGKPDADVVDADFTDMKFDDDDKKIHRGLKLDVIQKTMRQAALFLPHGFLGSWEPCGA